MYAKSSLRNYYLKMRNMIDFKHDETILARITENFLKFLISYKDIQATKTVIAGYIPMAQEVDLSGLLKSCEQLGYLIAMPVIVELNQSLKFRLCGSAPLTNPSKYYNKIYEPIDSYPYIEPDIVITPLIACDYQGHRLGYGRGFYDRTLSDLRKFSSKIIAIGICRDDFLIQKTIPFETHDQRLDVIITDRKIITDINDI